MSLLEALQTGVDSYNIWIGENKGGFVSNNPGHFTGVFYNKLLYHLRECAWVRMNVHEFYRRRLYKTIGVDDFHAGFDSEWRMISLSLKPAYASTLHGDRKSLIQAITAIIPAIEFKPYPQGKVTIELNQIINEIQNFKV